MASEDLKSKTNSNDLANDNNKIDSPIIWSDVHVHLQDNRFGSDLDIVFNRAEEKNVRRMICSATSPADWRRVEQLGQKRPQLLTTYGIHPWFLRGINGDWEQYLKSMLFRVPRSGFCPAVGEIGLDFAMREKDESLQEDFFRRQLHMAHQFQVPVIIHSVQATDRILSILSEFPRFPTLLFHGFVGTQQQIDKIIDLGGYFSFSFQNIKPNHKKAIETIIQTPLDRILLESDGPLLFPSKAVFGSNPPLMLEELGNDGFLLNEPALIPVVAAEIQKLKNVPWEIFCQHIQNNEKSFFAHWRKFSFS